ncbi:hypothetical protein [Micromonospora aurantiaca]|uniref:hypothetical protein n=1 Tax=Micromonospora aurantiaca (nom. illeg.) TaxID=47850 RepID=UPI003802A6E8
MYRIALRVTGVDLDDDDTVATLLQVRNDLTWMEVDGRTLAVLRTDLEPVGCAVQVARQITAALPGARVVDVDQDLVGVSDIAKRVGVTREAARLWVEGLRGPRNFPPPVASVGGGERGSMRLWQWASVNDWLRQYKLHDEAETLSAAQTAEVNAALLQVMGPFDRAWKQAQRRHLHVEKLKAETSCVDDQVTSGRTAITVDYEAAVSWHERRVVLGPGELSEQDERRAAATR